MSREIMENLLPGQTASDRPDIVARVFKQKNTRAERRFIQKRFVGQNNRTCACY